MSEAAPAIESTPQAAPTTVHPLRQPHQHHEYDQRSIRCEVDKKEIALFDPYDRQQILAIVRRINWLNEKIYQHAIEGRPVQFLRVERKAVRWALEQLGVTLPPNPPIPEPRSPSAVSVAPVTTAATNGGAA